MNPKADLLDMAVLQNEIHRRAADAGLGVQFVDKLLTPMFDPATKMISVPRITPPATMEDIDYLRGSIIHEIGHSNRVETVKRAIAAKINMQKPFGKVLNIVEDGAMEREIAGTWFGDAKSLGVKQDIHVRRQLDQIRELLSKNPDMKFDDEALKTGAIYLLGERYRNWDRWSQAARDRLKTELPREIVEIADKLDAAGWGHRMAKARTTEQVFDVAKALYKEMFPEDEKDPEDKDSTQNCQGEKDDTKEGGAEGEGEGQGKQPGKGQPKDTTIPWSALTTEHNTGGDPNHKAKIDYSGHRYRHPGNGVGILMPTQINKPVPKATPVPAVPSFIGRLRILLQSEKKNKFDFGLTSGRLDQRKLARLAMPIVPGSDGWRTVFKKRVPGRKINTAIQILVDGSGSMSGPKNELASDAADILCQAFTGPLRIKTAVHGFDACGRQNRIWPIKEFHENVVAGDVAKRSRGVGFSGNADGDAVIWGLNNIIKRPEKRKIIIVLSDGMPSDGTHVVDPGSLLKFAIQTARDRGVQVFGIGIEDSSVKHFYGADCKVIKSAHELPQALVDTLKTKI